MRLKQQQIQMGTSSDKNFEKPLSHRQYRKKALTNDFKNLSQEMKAGKGSLSKAQKHFQQC